MKSRSSVYPLIEFRDAEKNDSIKIIDGDRGVNYPKKEEMRGEGFCLFLNTGNIIDDHLSLDSADYISEEKDAKLRQGKLERKDVVLTTRGTVGSVAHYNQSIKQQNIRINSGMVILRTFSKMNDLYFYNIMKSDFLKQQFYLFSSGSAQPQLPIKDLRRIKIPVPSIQLQKKIAAILSTYDNLIENNNRRIAILEKMAEELYREWFVRLRFPGHEKVKIVKGVPEEWEIKELKEVASIIDCLHTKKPVQVTDGESWLLQLENIKENGRFSSKYKFMISKADYEEWTKNIEVTEGDCLITNVGRIAAIAQIPCGIRAALGRNMTAVRSTKIPATFLIQFLLSPHMKEEVLKKQDSGAIMGALNVRAINKLKITVPDNNLLNKFDVIVSSVRRSLWDISDANDLLETARDRLLSRLMSGKIDVENMDIQFPASMQEELAHA